MMYSTLKQATEAAQSKADRTGREFFVVFDPSSDMDTGRCYHVADQADLDGWFAGCGDPLVAVSSRN